MTESSGRVSPVPSVTETTPVRPVHPFMGREQIDLYERVFDGELAQPAAAPIFDQVTLLTHDDIARIEEHLPPELTVSSILGRVLEFHQALEHLRRGRLPAVDGHVDVDV
jgi:hypothetical protein